MSPTAPAVHPITVNPRAVPRAPAGVADGGAPQLHPQAEELRAQAEALALEHEPGDVQFDEEGGEGGTANVDRELDLHLSAQAQAAIEEIDAALDKITAGTYGFCESCGSPVPRPAGGAPACQAVRVLQERGAFGPPSMKTVRRRGALLVGVAAAVVALDQWTKSWAQGALASGPVHVLGP